MQNPSPASYLLSARQLTSFRKCLLRWFDTNARPLPWRRDRSPYEIWISEIMLQQTQVATVVPYFLRFLEAFPTLERLAIAQEQEVLKLWAGLGYYSRARNLHRAARILIDEHGGQWPRDVNATLRLPGLGKYTAHAVLSQAFDLRLPILEANTRRLLCRLSGERQDPRQKETEARLWHLSEKLLPRGRVGDFNQALMELGALVCRPEKPACHQCPLQSWCRAYQSNLQEQIPVRARPRVFEDVRELGLLIEKKNEVLVVQRPARGRWANMWEFPHLEWPEEKDIHSAASDLLNRLGLHADLCSERTVVKHGVTRFRIRLHCWKALYRSGLFQPGLYVDAKWIPPQQLSELGLSSPQRRLARQLHLPQQGQLF